MRYNNGAISLGYLAVICLDDFTVGTHYMDGLYIKKEKDLILQLSESIHYLYISKAKLGWCSDMQKHSSSQEVLAGIFKKIVEQIINSPLTLNIAL